MITIHHLDTSRSERIVWLAEELGIPYRIEPWQRQPNGAAPDALKAIHPLGKAPIIRDGDTVLAESGAIVEYLVHRHEADGRWNIRDDSRGLPARRLRESAVRCNVCPANATNAAWARIRRYPAQETTPC